jgi:hypothetical protein
LGHCPKESRLADARFADDERDPSAAFARLREHAPHCVDLCVAADQGRADDVVL